MLHILFGVLCQTYNSMPLVSSGLYVEKLNASQLVTVATGSLEP